MRLRQIGFVYQKTLSSGLSRALRSKCLCRSDFSYRAIFWIYIRSLPANLKPCRANLAIWNQLKNCLACERVVTQFPRSLFSEKQKSHHRNYACFIYFLLLFIFSITEFVNFTATPIVKPDEREAQKNPILPDDDKEAA